MALVYSLESKSGNPLVEIGPGLAIHCGLPGRVPMTLRLEATELPKAMAERLGELRDRDQ